jgi:hypothetical protein
MHITLWIVQVLLALLFLFAGGSKFVLPADQLTAPGAPPASFMRFIGVVEVLGGIGLILPSWLRILPWLTPLAAAGLVVVMIGAIVVTWIIGQTVAVLISIVVGLLAALVAYGRWRLRPIR